MDILSLPTVNPGLCEECGGQCCTSSMPGLVSPKQIVGLSVGRVLDLIEEGFGIGTCERESPTYVLRPRTIFEEGPFIREIPDRTAICGFHTSDGCSLSEESRPNECACLIPARDPETGSLACEPLPGTKERILEEWADPDIQELLYEAHDRLVEREYAT